MRKLFFILISLSLIPFYSCDDGDIITVELDFEGTFLQCGNNDLVFYKTKEDPSESLSLVISGRSLEDFLEVGDDNTYEETISISTTNTFNYRTYSNSTLPTEELFCNDVPNSDVILTQDIESTSGTAYFSTVLTEDDDDGITAELEKSENNPNLNGKDDFDGDGLDNYIDADDDGDNILTKDENPDPNGDGDLSDAQDTDDDGIPDYLDDDDDGDGVKTRDEENEVPQDQNPANDQTGTVIDPDTGLEVPIADYLNPNVDTIVPATEYREHSISRTFVVTLTISQIDLTILSIDTLDFGVLEDSALNDTRKETPPFN